MLCINATFIKYGHTHAYFEFLKLEQHNVNLKKKYENKAENIFFVKQEFLKFPFLEFDILNLFMNLCVLV